MLTRFLTAWTAWVIERASTVLAVIFLLTLAAGWYAVTSFQMNSDTSTLIRQDTKWKATHEAFIGTFPQYDRTTFVVVSGPGTEAVGQVTRTLADRIQARDDVFESVFAPAAKPNN